MFQKRMRCFLPDAKLLRVAAYRAWSAAALIAAGLPRCEEL